MDWMKQLLPLLQAGLSAYSGRQLLKKSSEGAKAVALQSSVIAFGSFSFLILFVASVIIGFVDLGNQLEAGGDLRFSGLMQSALYMFLLGLTILGSGIGVAKYLAAQEAKKKKAAEAEKPELSPLVLFGEELLKHLIVNLSQKGSANSSESQS